MAGKVLKRGFVLKPKTVVYALIVVVIVVALYLALSGSHGSVISSNMTVTLSANKSVDFSVSGLGGSYSLFLASSTNSLATFYISKLPALTNPIITFGLAKGGSANVSLNGSSYAHLQVKLLSDSQNQAEVELVRIPVGFDVLQSASVRSFTPTVMVSGTGSTNVVYTTTVNSSSGSSVSTTTTLTTTQTTTVKSTGFTTAQVLEAANKTTLGNLMVMYNAMYKRAQSCTPGLYNSTFIYKYGHGAVGSYDYYNASLNTPTGFEINTSEVSVDEYDISYTALIPTGNRLSLVMLVNVSSGAQISYQASGIFLDQNYTTMSESFVSVNSTNDCDPYVG